MWRVGKTYQAATSNRAEARSKSEILWRHFLAHTGSPSVVLAVLKFIMQTPAAMESPRLIFQNFNTTGCLTVRTIDSEL